MYADQLSAGILCMAVLHITVPGTSVPSSMLQYETVLWALQDGGLWCRLVAPGRGFWQGQVPEPAREVSSFRQRVLVSRLHPNMYADEASAMSAPGPG